MSARYVRALVVCTPTSHPCSHVACCVSGSCAAPQRSRLALITTITPQAVASFDLDHTRVRAPYVRLAGLYTGPRGDVISKFDLRLVQPNQAEIPTAPLHTIEHLLAGYLRGALSKTGAGEIIDASPMGCRTGFYLTLWGEPEESAVAEALRRSLEAVRRHQGEIPGCSEARCGNFRDHSLPGAQAWAERILQGEIIVQETVILP